MPTKTPRYWKKLQRHPLGAAYPDITGDAWTQFVKDVKEYGVVNRRKITLHEDKVLDGWQLYRACLEAGVKPEFQHLPKGVTPEQFVQIVNDNRRHETQEMAEKRVQERRLRVLEARAAGKSTRAIAEDEKVGETTVRRDLEEAGAPGGAPDEVKGRDGKTYRRKTERQPGDDTEAEETARNKPKPGKILFDRRKFDEPYGGLLRSIDALGKGYGAHNTPAAQGLRRLLKEFKDSFFGWQKQLQKGFKD